eukprot:gnl/TRDRNA2_/TRDRNA2_118259_c3_seq1.p2 gnl/TRDRNA2_/TRDRNA2_118259_c3~~gnl/TRDRNA2_/TRDRNA2_118259_c3_seq1.p2  ORF type:complete len:282 (+),score=27.12 gnl/TRDRNA2_/TRDRNA2_118259_c3_seq1:66-848(+)
MLAQEPDPAADEPPVARCDRCDFMFCPLCRDAYHPLSRCFPDGRRVELQSLQKRLACANRTERQRVQEELESLKLIMKHTMPCPHCKMPVHRSKGCNHMICAVCRVHFCYRCGKDITELGYEHFGGKSCPTFDREEVERINARQHVRYDGRNDEIDEELEELRRQYPDQAALIQNFRPPPGAYGAMGRRTLGRMNRPQEKAVRCPMCRQWNPKAGTNNHMRCRVCRVNFCFACGKHIVGVITDHFKGKASCPQHSTVGTA